MMGSPGCYDRLFGKPSSRTDGQPPCRPRAESMRYLNSDSFPEEVAVRLNRARRGDVFAFSRPHQLLGFSGPQFYSGSLGEELDSAASSHPALTRCIIIPATVLETAGFAN